jgi:hypothetical protein
VLGAVTGSKRRAPTPEVSEMLYHVPLVSN